MCTHNFQLSYLTGTRTPPTVTTTVTVNPPTTAVPPTTATTPPPIVVMINGNGGQLTAGENHMFTCEVTGGGTMTTNYQWLRNSAPLSGETSATLSFSPLRQSDSGVYTCEATRSSMTGTSAGVTITVAGEFEWPCIIKVTLPPPTVSTDPALSAVITASGMNIEGQSYSLTCTVQGTDPSAVSSQTFQWDKDGTEYSQVNPITFNPLMSSDAGEYRCTTTIGLSYLTGTRTVTNTLTVISKPNLNVYLHSGDVICTAFYSCNSHG